MRSTRTPGNSAGPIETTPRGRALRPIDRLGGPNERRQAGRRPPRIDRVRWSRRSGRLRHTACVEIPPELVARIAGGGSVCELDQRGTGRPRDGRPDAGPRVAARRADGADGAGRGLDGATEAILTLLATLAFGLGWAALELQAGDPALRPPTRTQMQTGYAAPTDSGGPLAGLGLGLAEVAVPAAQARPAWQAPRAGGERWTIGQSDPATRRGLSQDAARPTPRRSPR